MPKERAEDGSNPKMGLSKRQLMRGLALSQQFKGIFCNDRPIRFPKGAAHLTAFQLKRLPATFREAAGPVVFRIRPPKLKAKASAEGPSGKRALLAGSVLG